MQGIGEHRGHPKLKELVVEASRALARLDAARLEELALSCQALNRDLEFDLAHGDHGDGDGRAALAREAREAKGDMAVLARVLEATQDNLNVMNRLRELREGRLGRLAGRLEYGVPEAPQWRPTGNRNGDD
ncbi:MAG: hypothetical protein ABSC48_08880 [Terracidiphilus sp.]